MRSRINSPVNRIGALLSNLGIMGALFLMLSMPLQAHAKSRVSILGTMGISIAVGTVLGASTLPFYDQPGTHLGNLAIGAAAGAVVGLGILVYGWLGPSQDEGASLQGRSFASSGMLKQEFGLLHAEISQLPKSPSANLWMPIVSLTW